MKHRATPQLALPLGPSVEPRRATVPFVDDSPFDPAETSWEQPARATPRLEPKAPPAPPPEPRRIEAAQVQRLSRDLRVLIGGPIQVEVHDNRSTMISFRRQTDYLKLRLHHMFLHAGPEVIRALADYARARSPRAGHLLDQFVKQHRAHIRVDREQARHRDLQARGAVHDLQACYDVLNRRYFGGAIQARIGWGRGTTSRRRRSIRMGAYYHETQTILIHPALDRMEVPDYFVTLVVYHEMLHQAVPQKRMDTGRRSIHSPEFRRRERQFHDFERARSWEKRNLPILLRAPRS